MYTKLSQLFKTLFVLAVIVLVTVVTTTPVLAKPEKQTYSYDFWSGDYHYIGNGSYSWSAITNKNVSVYTWSGSGEYYVYKGSILVDRGSWTYHGHQTMKEGQTAIYHSSGKGSYGGDHSYKYVMTITNGRLVMNHYWFDGKKAY